MTKVGKETIALREKLLKDMHKYIIDIGDEDIYDEWITFCVPDEPSDEDFFSIVIDDENWIYCCKTFYRLVRIDLKENY